MQETPPSELEPQLAAALSLMTRIETLAAALPSLAHTLSDAGFHGGVEIDGFYPEMLAPLQGVIPEERWFAVLETHREIVAEVVAPLLYSLGITVTQLAVSISPEQLLLQWAQRRNQVAQVALLSRDPSAG